MQNWRLWIYHRPQSKSYNVERWDSPLLAYFVQVCGPKHHFSSENSAKAISPKRSCEPILVKCQNHLLDGMIVGCFGRNIDRDQITAHAKTTFCNTAWIRECLLDMSKGVLCTQHPLHEHRSNLCMRMSPGHFRVLQLKDRSVSSLSTRCWPVHTSLAMKPIAILCLFIRAKLTKSINTVLLDDHRLF